MTYFTFKIVMIISTCFWFLMAYTSVKLGSTDEFDIKFYYWSSYQLIILIVIDSWVNAYISIQSFYIYVAIIFFAYLFLYSFIAKTMKKSLKRIEIQFLTVIYSLSFIFWIISLFGKFLHDNYIIPLSDLYENIPVSAAWYDVKMRFYIFKECLITSIKFFKVGFNQLFDATPDGEWSTFIHSFKWFCGSVVTVVVLNIILTVFGILNINFDDK